MKHSSTSFRRPEAAALGALAWIASAGCVLPGTHQAVIDERDGLAEERALLERRVTTLEATNESLSNERVSLIEEVETLRDEFDSLTEQVAGLEARRSELESQVATQELALAEATGEVDALRGTYDGLVQDLQDEVASGRIEIEQLRDGLRVQLTQAILFPTGSAELGSEGRAVLAKVGERLRGGADQIQVRGHTDNRRIHGRLARTYPSNWELGGARASAVVRWLEAQGLASERLVAVSYGATRPIAPNDDDEQREQNRRIEIRLVPQNGGAVVRTAPDAAPDVAAPPPSAE